MKAITRIEFARKKCHVTGIDYEKKTSFCSEQFLFHYNNNGSSTLFLSSFTGGMELRDKKGKNFLKCVKLIYFHSILLYFFLE